MYTSSWRKYTDNRTWHLRVRRARENWDPLLPALAAAYLSWKYPPPVASDGGPSSHPNEPLASPIDECLDFHITIIDIYSLDASAYIPRNTDSNSPAEALAFQGYLGNSPLAPNIAISFRTIELYRRIRLRKPSFSVEAFAKVICDLYNVSSRSCHLICYLHID